MDGTGNLYGFLSGTQEMQEMKFEEQFEKFYTSTKSIYKELVNISGDSDVWKSLFDRVSLEEISKELSKQSLSLFRYGDVEKSIDTLQWKYILEQSWKTGGHFPTLYKVNQIYDKREVVICFLMVMQFSLKEADEFLRAVSFNEQNYDNRELYPLHYKEGFFRFVILWNEQHDHVLSFDMAVDYYKKYEEIVSVYVLKMAEKVLGSKESLEDGKDLKKYKNMKYYCDLLEPIWKEMCQWKHPYTLRQQDILQRMLVLVSHAERAQREYNESGSEDMLEYNDKTRGLQDRGTRLCISIAEECAGISKFPDAMKCFADRELPEMGEAYWRAISYIMQAYAESGKSPYYESALIEKRIFY